MSTPEDNRFYRINEPSRAEERVKELEKDILKFLQWQSGTYHIDTSGTQGPYKVLRDTLRKNAYYKDFPNYPVFDQVFSYPDVTPGVILMVRDWWLGKSVCNHEKGNYYAPEYDIYTPAEKEVAYGITMELISNGLG